MMCNFPPSVLRVDAAEGYAVYWVMSPEENPWKRSDADTWGGTITFLFHNEPTRSRDDESHALPALAVGQRDALWCHLKLDYSGCRTRGTTQCGICCLGDGLGAGQGLGFHRAQVEDVTGWVKKQTERAVFYRVFHEYVQVLYIRVIYWWNTSIHSLIFVVILINTVYSCMSSVFLLRKY